MDSVIHASHMVAVLHSLPSGAGVITRRRVEIASEALGCSTSSIANVFPARLNNVNALPEASSEAIWALGREELRRELHRGETTDVLLGFGIQEPSGAPRTHYREQLAWLASELEIMNVRVWVFGGRPTHPSRWQRVTHRHAAGQSVAEACHQLLTPFTLAKRR